MTLSASPFDTKFFGLPIGRFSADSVATVAALEADARAAGYGVVFIRVADGEPFDRALRAAGHTPIDTLVTSTLVRPPPKIPARRDVEIELVDRLGDADADTVAAITSASIATSHLHYDRRLPVERTRALYAAWARNDVTGRGQQVFVARVAGVLVGYIAVLTSPNRAVIDLVAVDRAYHGAKIGSTLMHAFVSWAAPQHDLVATVGTQSDNPALALYGRCGFTPTAIDHTYHLWLD